MWILAGDVAHRTCPRVQLQTAVLWFVLFPGLARGDAFASYRYAGSFRLPSGSGPLDVLDDGRLIVIIQDDLYAETAAGSGSFAPYGALPGADFPSFGAAFLRVSPDGSKIAVGDNGGDGLSEYHVGVFDLRDLSGTWFSATHFDAEWIDDRHIALTGGDFGSPSFVTVLDTLSPDASAPVNPRIIDGIGGASGGIAFDAAGNLYTGNGFQFIGPSGTGAVKAFSYAAWTAAGMGGPAVDFETDGVLVVDVLSASPIGFDGDGNLYVGGGDFSSSTEMDFVALLRNHAVLRALGGLGPVETDHKREVRRLDPDAANDLNYFSANFNEFLGRLYVRDGDVLHVYQKGRRYACSLTSGD